MTITQLRVLYLVLMLLSVPVVVSGMDLVLDGDMFGIINIVMGGAIWLVGIYLMLPRIKFFRSNK